MLVVNVSYNFSSRKIVSKLVLHSMTIAPSSSWGIRPGRRCLPRRLCANRSEKEAMQKGGDAKRSLCLFATVPTTIINVRQAQRLEEKGSESCLHIPCSNGLIKWILGNRRVASVNWLRFVCIIHPQGLQQSRVQQRSALFLVSTLWLQERKGRRPGI